MFFVIPAKAGIQPFTRGSAEETRIAADAAFDWIPAYAGMTRIVQVRSVRPTL